MMRYSCQPIEKRRWHSQNIKRCQGYVLSMQRKLDKAVGEGNIARTPERIGQSEGDTKHFARFSRSKR
jgi:hypothetical protein